MCKHGTTVEMEVVVPAHLSYTNEDRVAMKPIDSCIAEIVRALNDGGVRTISSCCGHGRSGAILLADGRELVVQPRSGRRRWFDRFRRPDVFPRGPGQARNPAAAPPPPRASAPPPPPRPNPPRPRASTGKTHI